MGNIKVDKQLLKINNEVIHLDKLALIEVGRQYNEDLGMYRLRVFNSSCMYKDIEGTHTWEEKELFGLLYHLCQELNQTHPEFVNFGISKLVNLSNVVDIKQTTNSKNQAFAELYFDNSKIKFPIESKYDYIHLLEDFENYKSNVAEM